MKEGLACNLYSHQVGAISIAEEKGGNGETGNKKGWISLMSF